MHSLKKCVICAIFIASTLVASTHKWGYTGHDGPEHWGELDSEFKECAIGKQQSPINITHEIEVHEGELDPIEFHYDSETTHVINNGHTVQVNMADGSYMIIDDKKFFLKQFHFHSPSENEIEGVEFPLEAHLVHVANDGALAVVAILFEEGKTNLVLEHVWAHMNEEIDSKVDFHIPAKEITDFLLPHNRSYFRFMGSLTTPPCTEGVRWFVFKEYDTVSKEQVQEFLKVLHHTNNRPIQRVGDRKVFY